MIARIYHIFAALTALVWIHSAPLTAQDAASVRALKEAIALARMKDWPAAQEKARSGGPLVVDIVEWHRLRRGEGRFEDTIAFLDRRSDWPGLKYLRKRSEKTIPRGGATAPVLAFFKDTPPQTGRGALRLAEALMATGQDNRARDVLVTAWQTLPMDQDEHDAFVTRYPGVLKGSHRTRADAMLWQGNTKDAARMLPLLSKGQAALTRARIGLRRKANGVDGLISAVPGPLTEDPGLAYERFLWRASKGRNQDAADLLLARSSSLAALGEPDRWGSWRRVLARWSMRDGKAKQAYQLASQHQLSEGSNYNDLEWLSGYIALRKLNDPKTALYHFKRFRAGVFTPISLGRAGYWTGRAYQAMGKSAEAQEAYSEGAKYQTSFYGLLAAEKAGVPMDPNLTGRERHRNFATKSFWNSSVMQAARLLQAAGELYWTERFVVHLAERLDRDGVGHLAGWAENKGEPHLRVMLAKYAAKQGWILHRPYFPTPDIGRGNAGVPRALELAIARRESEFDPGVVSGAGARGLMQLMPGTAKDMAKRVGISYSKSRLTTDPAYNTRLGSEYLAKLIEEFNGNPVLIAVGYNAGPGRSRSWTKRFGDPRAGATDIVDWIEHIPFRETRNYVMRVTESLPVYRARLTGKTQPLRLSKELKQ